MIHESNQQSTEKPAVKQLNHQKCTNFTFINFYLFEQLLQFFDRINQNGHHFSKQMVVIKGSWSDNVIDSSFWSRVTLLWKLGRYSLGSSTQFEAVYIPE